MTPPHAGAREAPDLARRRPDPADCTVYGGSAEAWRGWCGRWSVQGAHPARLRPTRSGCPRRRLWQSVRRCCAWWQPRRRWQDASVWSYCVDMCRPSSPVVVSPNPHVCAHSTLSSPPPILICASRALLSCRSRKNAAVALREEVKEE
jgi:hypothetical protein